MDPIVSDGRRGVEALSRTLNSGKSDRQWYPATQRERAQRTTDYLSKLINNC